MLKENFRHNLRVLRHEKEWSQEYIAQQLGISTIGYYKIEAGKTIPNLDRLEQLANVLEVEIGTLLGLGDRILPISYNEH